MIAFRFQDIEKRRCLVRGVEYRSNLFNNNTDIINTEEHPSYPTDRTTEINFEELPDIVRARVTMLTLTKNEDYIEGVGCNRYNFMYICEEE